MDRKSKEIKKGRFADLCGVSEPPRSRARECSARFFHWFLVLSFLILEGLGVWLFMREKSLWGMNFEASIVALHTLASLLLPVALFPWLPKSYRQSWCLSSSLIFGLCSSLPIFGPICVLLVIKLLNKTGSREPKEVGHSFVTGSRVPSAEEQNLELGMNGSMSILQIRIGPDPLARRNLILATKRLGAEFAIPILRTGLRDDDDEVKLYSQAILSQLVEQYEKTIADLKKALEAAPEDVESMIRLAKGYFEIVELDLITDEDLQIFYINRSIALLKEVLVHESENEEALITLTKYHLRIENTAEAAGCLERLREMGVALELIEPFEVELLFLRRSWDSFREKVRDGLLNRYCDPGLLSVEGFWFGHGSGIERSRMPRSLSGLTG